MTAALILFSLTLSCEQVPAPDKGFELTEQNLGNIQNIPVSYGKLVSVTAPTPGVAHLWFEDENLTIRMVQVNYGKNFVHKEVNVIKRD